MTELTALLIAWTIVTILGHGTWVAIRAFFRLISGAAPRLGGILKQADKADFAATRRVLRRMVERDLLDDAAANDLGQQIVKLEYPGWKSKSPAITPAVAPDNPATAPDNPAAAPDNPAAAPDNRSSQPPLPTGTGAIDQQPAIASLVESTPLPSSRQPLGETTPATQPEPQQPPMAVLSRSELIQSFLAAHNIRWGELVAGLLIVVCSIGLVISLWSPLVETHRVVPSLIFLGANAAIYAAGLYTLSRWRLRHTSRAVLVIATLLVPLSVLAGLAAAGTTRDAIQLTDPITLAAIALSGCVYLYVLYRGGKALSSHPLALPIVISVAGPVAVLPMVPASVRVWGAHAGWIVGLGSFAILWASIQLSRLRNHSRGSVGMAGGRARLLAMAFGAFSLAVTIGYCVFIMQEGKLEALLPIAIASVPALVALAASSQSLAVSARSTTQSMSAAVSCLLLLGLAWAVLPASMTASFWVWSWAIAFAGTAVVVGWNFRQPQWLALATFPLGMAATFSAPVWLGSQQWDAISLWRRIVGGEPMIAALLVSVLVAAASFVISDARRRTWIRYAAVLWAVVSVAIAGMLSVAPLSALGIVSWWWVTAVLVAATVSSAIVASRHPRAAWLPIGTTAFTWLSVFRPIQWDAPLASADVWMMTVIGFAATMLVLRELVPKWRGEVSVNKPAGTQSTTIWGHAGDVGSIVGGVIACGFAQQDWASSAITLGAASALLFWSSTISRNIALVRWSQAGTVAFAVVIGHGQFESWLFDDDAWTSGVAVWGWALAAALTAGVWVLIRQVSRISDLRWEDRFAYLRKEQCSPSRMPDGWLTAIGAGLFCVGSLWTFAAVLARAGGSDALAMDMNFGLPIAVLAACCGVHGATQRLETEGKIFDWTAVSLGIAGIVWTASRFAPLVTSDSAGELIVAVTLAAAACFLVSMWLVPQLEPRRSKPAGGASLGTAVLLMATASAVLLVQRWWKPINGGAHAHALSTLAVAGWWMSIAVGGLWRCKRMPDSPTAAVSAFLFPAAAAITVPVYSLAHPVVWLQVAAIASVVWIFASRAITKSNLRAAIRPANDFSVLFVLVVGIASSLLVTTLIVLDTDALAVVAGPASCIVSVLAFGLWCFWMPTDKSHCGAREIQCAASLDHWLPRLPWPLGLSLLVGQIGWLISVLNPVSRVNLLATMTIVWVTASLVSLIQYQFAKRRLRVGADDLPSLASTRKIQWFHFAHVAVISVIVVILTGVLGNRSEWMPWLALIALSIAGVQVAFVAGYARVVERKLNRLSSSESSQSSGMMARVAPSPAFAIARLLGWFVVVAGSIILCSRIASAADVYTHWTLLVTWSAIWVVCWRLLSVDGRERIPVKRAAAMVIPDMEFAAAILAAVVLETILFTLSGRHVYQASVLGDPLLWGRLAAYLFVAASAAARAGRRLAWPLGIGTVVAAVALLSVQTSIHFDATPQGRIVCATLASGFAIAFIAHWLPSLARLVMLGQNRLLTWRSERIRGMVNGHMGPEPACSESDTEREFFTPALAQLGQLVQAAWQVACVIALLSGIAAVTMIVGGAPAVETNLTIIAIALCAWATAEIAEACRGERLRHAAVTLSLITIALWASVDTGETYHPALIVTMRWLVASVVTIPMLLFVFPNMAGASLATNWREALQRGAIVAGVAAGCSLISMLGMEAAIRSETGIENLGSVMVVGVAVTLAILSALSGLIAVLSGPDAAAIQAAVGTQRRWRDRLQLTDGQRTLLIVAAQVVAALTWLHLFLCKSHWAFIGLRAYWPYTVMGLAFLSVGVTEWARRRQDEVMSHTLSHTALYLPLLPVIGFWLSGNQLAWVFPGGRVEYELLLAIGSVYYIALASIWKGIVPRVAAVALGNAAWWVLLAQQPGWGFLVHPQIWLIPPAIGVLVVTHYYRQRLPAAAASAIRYGCTLLIYVSSTADILLQQIGSNLWGPVILVSLSLAGMATGVILRVRPFLYLGALFVFLGVTSMVWHAHLAIDAVWPWWVFGITTGICLLAGLMALEKNKAKLRQYANQLATWQG